MNSLRRRFSTATQLWIVIAALGQAVMPAVASIVDASPSAASVTQSIRPHIEEHGSPKCPRVHQEDTCALCQFVTGAVAVKAADVATLSANQRAFAAPRAPDQTPAWLVNSSPSLPRAPPVLA